MRIKLKKGKQKELILKAKNNKTWKQLSNKLKISEGYLKSDLRIEKILLNKELYNELCKIANVNFDEHIEKSLEDNWGRSKGGKLSINTKIKKIIIPKINENFAEVIGIILGDGHVGEFKKGKKVRCYSITIAGNMQTDIDYMTRYIPLLFKKVFNEIGKVSYSKTSHTGYFKIYGKEFINFLKKQGLMSGNKKKNNQGIPKWIKKDKKLLIKCIKGLIDTDGSIHKISKKHKNLRIDYTSYIPQLLNDVRESFILLGFNPSKIISDKHIFLTGKESVEKYLKEIGFGNKKNLNRLIDFKKRMPR